MKWRFLIKNIYKAARQQVLALDYPWKPKSRYQQNKPLNQNLNEVFDREFDQYLRWVSSFKMHLDFFKSISLKLSSENHNIYWQNDYLPGLDIILIYTLIQEFKPKNILEIGSGHSTAVMRKAIQDGQFSSSITCIDPNPRRTISAFADQVFYESLEDLKDIERFRLLNKNDILFFDGSHLSLANTDVTVFFMEVLPVLNPGVIVQIHDIYLPFDYPDDMVQRGYNEQYLLAQVLWYGWPEKIEVLFPAYWMSRQKRFQYLMESAVWNVLATPEIERHGGSFWFRIK